MNSRLSIEALPAENWRSIKRQNVIKRCTYRQE